VNITVRRGKRQRSSIQSTPFTVEVSVEVPGRTIITGVPPAPVRRHGSTRSLRNKIGPLVTPTTPPRIILNPARKQKPAAPIARIVRTPWPNVTPIPASAKPIPLFVRAIARPLRPGRTATTLITRRDHGNGWPSPQPIIARRHTARRRVGKATVVSSPGTPYPFTRAVIGRLAKHKPFRRTIQVLKSTFFPTTQLPKITIGSRPARPRKHGRIANVVNPRVFYAAISRPTVIVGTRAIGKRRVGAASFHRSRGVPTFRPNLSVFKAQPHGKPAKPPVVLKTKRHSEYPVKPKSFSVAPRPARKPIGSSLLQSAKGGQVGPLTRPTPIVRARPAPLPLRGRARILKGGQNIAAQTPIPSRLSFHRAKPKLRRGSALSTFTRGPSPLGMNPRPRHVIGVRPAEKRKVGKATVPVSTPLGAAGMAISLPNAMAVWLLQQPAFVNAFAWDALTHDCVSADWDDPGDAYPYFVYREPLGHRDYISDGSFEEDGQIEIAVLHPEKETARVLGTIVGSILKDAPLEFLGGSVFYFRWVNPGFPPVAEPGTQQNTWVWRRVLIFEYKIDGYDLPVLT